MLASLLTVVIPVFAASSMLSVGLGYGTRQIVGPLRDARGVITAVIANFLAVPLLAAGVARLVSLEPSLETGLILVGMAAGAPFLVKLAQLGKGDVAFAASILVLLVLVTLVYMPIIVPYLWPAGTISAASIAEPLILSMLLPLGLALATKSLWPTLAARLRRAAGLASNVSLALLVVLTLVVNTDAIRGTFGSGALLAATLFIGGAFGIGFLLGTFDPRERMVLGFASAHRNFAAAMVVAVESFHDEEVLVMTVVASVVSIVLLIPAAWAFGRRRKRGADDERHGFARRHALAATTRVSR